jgi:predicted DNA-binding protein
MTSRLELRLSDTAAQNLENFAEESGTTKAEIIRRALTLYALAKDSGLYTRKDGVEQRILVL